MVYRVYNTEDNVIFHDKVFPNVEEARNWLVQHNYNPSGILEDEVNSRPLTDPGEDSLWGYDVTEDTSVIWDSYIKRWEVRRYDNADKAPTIKDLYLDQDITMADHICEKIASGIASCGRGAICRPLQETKDKYSFAQTKKKVEEYVTYYMGLKILWQGEHDGFEQYWVYQYDYQKDIINFAMSLDVNSFIREWIEAKLQGYSDVLLDQHYKFDNQQKQQKL